MAEAFAPVVAAVEDETSKVQMSELKVEVNPFSQSSHRESFCTVTFPFQRSRTKSPSSKALWIT